MRNHVSAVCNKILNTNFLSKLRYKNRRFANQAGRESIIRKSNTNNNNN